MFGSGMNLITTIIGFGMSATFIVFVCTRIICGRLRRRESRQMFEIDSRMDFEIMPEYRISGLDPVVVAAIPTVKFYRESFGSLEDAQCVICLGEYEDKEVLRIMPKCGHTYHLSCIDVWLKRQSTCPVCRLPVHDSSENERVPSANHVSEAQSFDSTEMSVEHSRLWLLPAADQSEVHRNNDMPANYVTIEMESGSAEIAPARS
ncbi:hypothetical protein LIER_16351 [Lithospermum erythrorhizon]|uniref:RING-type domain-containing protein n=1 Tax=Lithospermum erythrorhizon TaxID=34254 RepID=A0AAV3QAX1_LITER